MFFCQNPAGTPNPKNGILLFYPFQALKLSFWISVCVCVCVYIYIYIYTHFFPVVHGEINFYIFISGCNLAEISNPDWPHLRNKAFGCCCEVHIIMNRYLSKKYQVCHFDCVASGYSNCSQLKYVSLCPTCILSEKVAFYKMGKPLSERKSLSKLSAGDSAPPLLQQLSVCHSADHWQPGYMSKILQSFSSTSKSYFFPLLWRLILCNQKL